MQAFYARSSIITLLIIFLKNVIPQLTFLSTVSEAKKFITLYETKAQCNQIEAGKPILVKWSFP